VKRSSPWERGVHGNGDRHKLREWSSVIWNGSARTTTVVGPSQLTATITATDATTAVTAQVTATVSGRTPPATTFTINNPARSLESFAGERIDGRPRVHAGREWQRLEQRDGTLERQFGTT